MNKAKSRFISAAVFSLLMKGKKQNRAAVNDGGKQKLQKT